MKRRDGVLKLARPSASNRPAKVLRATVIVPTHNPRSGYLAQTLAALRNQTLALHEWELLLIDNASSTALDASLVQWHPNGRVIRESRLGLTAARFRGLREASADLLVWADDDNILAPDYVQAAVRFFAERPGVGAGGGKATPVYESAPPPWYRSDLAPLGCRDLGNQELSAKWTSHGERRYPEAAPIGAGLVIRRAAMATWAEAVERDPVRQKLGRTGQALTSGEDNDIALTLLAAGWELAYTPTLTLQHLIPSRRLTLDYQQRIARATFRDFTRVLLLHDASPWPPISRRTMRLRQLKAWFTCRAWTGPAAQIRWSGLCGHFEGRVAQRPGEPRS
jgi:glycosyltransferase involved in cell wall biosynthesis